MGKHWVPQHLLKGFAADGNLEMVVQYDKQGNDPKTVPIKNASQSRAAFSEDVECIMASIERTANSLVSYLRDTPDPLRLHDNAKRLFAVYLSMFTWRRDRTKTDAIERQITPELVRKIQSEVAMRYGESTRKEILARADVVAGIFAGGQENIVRGIWLTNAATRFLLYRMTWTLLETSEKADFLIPQSALIQHAPDGFDAPNCVLFLPISTHRALQLSWVGGDGDIRILTAPNGLVEMVNRLGVEQSERFIYAHAKNRMVQKVVQDDAMSAGQFYPLQVNGQNSFSDQLDAFRTWRQAGDAGGGFEVATNTICMAPGAPQQEVYPGLQVSVHEWSQNASRVPFASDIPDSMMSVVFCNRCGYAKETHDDGTICYSSTELHMATNTSRPSNWWDRRQLEKKG